jgi:hypothetical protein
MLTITRGPGFAHTGVAAQRKAKTTKMLVLFNIYSLSCWWFAVGLSRLAAWPGRVTGSVADFAPPDLRLARASKSVRVCLYTKNSKRKNNTPESMFRALHLLLNRHRPPPSGVCFSVIKLLLFSCCLYLPFFFNLKGIAPSRIARHPTGSRS